MGVLLVSETKLKNFTNINNLGSILISNVPQNVNATGRNLIFAGNSLNFAISAASNLSSVYFTIGATRSP